MYLSSLSLVLIALATLWGLRATYKAGYRRGKGDEQLRLFTQSKATGWPRVTAGDFE